MPLLVTSSQRQRLREAEPPSLPATLAATLAANHSRVIDLFRALDPASAGSVSMSELRRKLEQLGLQITPLELSELFDRLDPSGSGRIQFEDLRLSLLRALREQGSRGDLAPDSQLQHKHGSSAHTRRTARASHLGRKGYTLPPSRSAQRQANEPHQHHYDVRWSKACSDIGSTGSTSRPRDGYGTAGRSSTFGNAGRSQREAENIYSESQPNNGQGTNRGSSMPSYDDLAQGNSSSGPGSFGQGQMQPRLVEPSDAMCAMLQNGLQWDGAHASQPQLRSAPKFLPPQQSPLSQPRVSTAEQQLQQPSLAPFHKSPLQSAQTQCTDSAQRFHEPSLAPSNPSPTPRVQMQPQAAAQPQRPQVTQRPPPPPPLQVPRLDAASSDVSYVHELSVEQTPPSSQHFQQPSSCPQPSSSRPCEESPAHPQASSSSQRLSQTPSSSQPPPAPRLPLSLQPPLNTQPPPSSQLQLSLPPSSQPQPLPSSQPQPSWQPPPSSQSPCLSEPVAHATSMSRQTPSTHALPPPQSMPQLTPSMQTPLPLQQRPTPAPTVGDRVEGLRQAVVSELQAQVAELQSQLRAVVQAIRTESRAAVGGQSSAAHALDDAAAAAREVAARVAPEAADRAARETVSRAAHEAGSRAAREVMASVREVAMQTAREVAEAGELRALSKMEGAVGAITSRVQRVETLLSQAQTDLEAVRSNGVKPYLGTNALSPSRSSSRSGRDGGAGWAGGGRAAAQASAAAAAAAAREELNVVSKEELAAELSAREEARTRSLSQTINILREEARRVAEETGRELAALRAAMSHQQERVAAAEAREASAATKAELAAAREREQAAVIDGERCKQAEGLRDVKASLAELNTVSAEEMQTRKNEIASLRADVERLSGTAASLHTAANTRISAVEQSGAVTERRLGSMEESVDHVASRVAKAASDLAAAIEETETKLEARLLGLEQLADQREKDAAAQAAAQRDLHDSSVRQLADAVEAVHTSSEKRDAELRSHLDAQLVATDEASRTLLAEKTATLREETSSALARMQTQSDDTRLELSNSIAAVVATASDLGSRLSRLEEGFLLVNERVAALEEVIKSRASAAEIADLREMVSRCATREEAEESAVRATATALAGTHRAWEAGMAMLGSDMGVIGISEINVQGALGLPIGVSMSPPPRTPSVSQEREEWPSHPPSGASALRSTTTQVFSYPPKWSTQPIASPPALPSQLAFRQSSPLKPALSEPAAEASVDVRLATDASSAASYLISAQSITPSAADVQPILPAPRPQPFVMPTPVQAPPTVPSSNAPSGVASQVPTVSALPASVQLVEQSAQCGRLSCDVSRPALETTLASSLVSQSPGATRVSTPHTLPKLAAPYISVAPAPTGTHSTNAAAPPGASSGPERPAPSLRSMDLQRRVEEQLARCTLLLRSESGTAPSAQPPH